MGPCPLPLRSAGEGPLERRYEPPDLGYGHGLDRPARASAASRGRAFPRDLSPPPGGWLARPRDADLLLAAGGRGLSLASRERRRRDLDVPCGLAAGAAHRGRGRRARG